MYDQSVELILSQKAKSLWELFLMKEENFGHVNRMQYMDSIEMHIQNCWEGALKTVNSISLEFGDGAPKNILEIGCSTGIISFACQASYPGSNVYGIEPENEAVEVAKSMSLESSIKSPEFLCGVGENLPFKENTFDLVICHTVIEHVENVDNVIKEIARVLNIGGVCHLDAPNYIFPYEPHLGIYTLPLLGKNFVRLTAIIQGKGKHTNFLGHLKFVTPFVLEKSLKKYNLTWTNRAHNKITNLISGSENVKKYKYAETILRFAHKLNFSWFFYILITKFKMYPSLLYTVRKVK
jgi:ubiquinone/menaquinone biosynthesis C-methylase UbiE